MDRAGKPGDPAPLPPSAGAGGWIDELDARVRSIQAALSAGRERPGRVVALVVAGALVLGGAWWLGRPTGAVPLDDAIPRAAAPASIPGGPGVEGGVGSPGASPEGSGGGAGPAAPPPETAGPGPVVHVAGAVARPGIVTLEPGARVIDALDAAGGPAADADLDQLNLAAPVVDGQQVRVPRQGEVLPPAAVATGPAAAVGPVDVNRATAVELERLPGIGPTLAAAIVAWRDEHGRFDRLDDLLDVPGIGPAKLAALADAATV